MLTKTKDRVLDGLERLLLGRAEGLSGKEEPVVKEKPEPVVESTLHEFNYHCTSESCGNRISCTKPMTGYMCFACHTYSLKPDIPVEETVQ